MARVYCRQPNDCAAGSKGSCRVCHDTSAHAERMRALHRDSDWAAKNVERSRARMTAMWADPAFAAMVSERSRERVLAQNADPHFISLRAARLKAFNIARRLPPMTATERRLYAKLRPVVGRDAALAAIKGA